MAMDHLGSRWGCSTVPFLCFSLGDIVVVRLDVWYLERPIRTWDDCHHYVPLKLVLCCKNFWGP